MTVPLISLFLLFCSTTTVISEPAQTPVTVFMCADSEDYSGAHELSFIQDAMINPRAVDIPFCQTACFGQLVGKDGTEFSALAVTTEIGYVSSTSCTVQLMRYSSYTPTSIVFLGTSGFSPFQGGFDPLNKASGCNPIRNGVPKNAIKSTFNSIFVGAERDYLCREYTAQVTKLPISEVVCVQAMEGFGFLKAMWDFPDIPVALVRAASNYDMYPLKRPADGRWEQNINYVSEEEYGALVNASFHYSVKAASFFVANYFLGSIVDIKL
ncbi:hypothetical protein LSM04_007799 [Trypanosoma melophagium]|uniref:uncharacterized protein n=1 Tax=Trypanosoma melophagium TaxID=715481 RepID=UPI00351A7CD8|nr:hypothetical protein LSM04_007799 [Trypanosoma melophagium]